MTVQIRKIRIEDCPACAKVVTLGWNQTYQGIVDNSFLELLKENEKARADKSISEFAKNKDNTLVLEVDSQVVGFITYNKADNSKYQNCGEIRAFYIINDYKGKGYGKKMFINATKELIKRGYNQMIIGCLIGNKSNEFYKHLGGKKVDETTIIRGNQELKENIYYYEDLKTLINQLTTERKK